ncbi:MAG: DNA polymerase III subunit delta [Nitrospirae bacterium]|nr:DNA polymerase III subunit delta [Nitrospirota bacterium]
MSAAGIPLDPPAPVYLVHGPEQLLRDEAVAAIVGAALDPSLADFNHDRFEAGQCRPEEVVAAAQMLPVMAALRVVVVRGVERFKAEALAPLAAYVADPSPSTCLVLEGEKVDMRRALFVSVKKVGQVVECKPPYDNQLVPWIMARVRGTGRSISPEAAQFMANYTGANLGALAGELEKAATYAGGGPIDLTAVSETVGAGRVHTVFELTDALGDRRPAAALKALATLLDSGEAPLRVQAIIVRHYRLLWRAHEARRAGAGDLARTLGVAPFLAKKLTAQAGRYGGDELAGCVRRFAQVDLDLKGGALSPRRALEDEVLALTRRAPAGAGRISSGR